MRAWPLLLALSVVPPLVALAAVRADALGAARVELTLSDALQRSWRAGAPRSVDVVVLAIDDASLAAIDADPELRLSFGAWPFARSLWATLIDRLSTYRARAVVIDAVFEQRSPDEGEDALFAEALARHPGFPVFAGLGTGAAPAGAPPPPAQVFAPGVTLAGLEAQPLEPLAHYDALGGFAGVVPAQLIPPAEPFGHAFTGLGLVDAEADADGKLRRTRFVRAVPGATLGTLALVAARRVLGGEASLAPGRLVLGPRRLAVDGDGGARLDYGGPFLSRFGAVRLIDLLRDRSGALAGRLAGKVVVVGGFAVGTADAHDTPFERAVPGVVKTATELDGLLAGAFLTETPVAAVLVFAMLLSLVGAALVLATRAWPFELLAPFGAVAVVWLVDGLALRFGATLGGVLVPALAAVVACLGAVTFNRFYASRDRELLRETFGRYMERELVELVVDGADLSMLQAKQIEITAFFSDIRGFSSFSEALRDRPELLREVMNTYLTRVTAALVEHGACIDKYIGDAVVALYGAPVPFADHALRACRGALAVRDAVEVLRKEFEARGLPDVYTRIGLNTDLLMVGNFGSEQLVDYTAVGDGMNLAARLEATNKIYRSTILAGPKTRAQASPTIAFREVDTVRVPGKTEAVVIHEVLGLAASLPESVRSMVARYEEGLAHFRGARFAEAVTCLEAALTLVGTDGPCEVLLARCRRLAAEPPKDFEPVSTLEK